MDLAEKIANSIFINIVNPILTVLFLCSVVYFIWTVIAFLTADASTRGDRKRNLFTSVFGLFIIVSTYTILFFIARLGNSDVILQEKLFFDGGV